MIDFYAYEMKDITAVTYMSPKRAICKFPQSKTWPDNIIRKNYDKGHGSDPAVRLQVHSMWWVAQCLCVWCRSAEIAKGQRCIKLLTCNHSFITSWSRDDGWNEAAYWSDMFKQIHIVHITTVFKVSCSLFSHQNSMFVFDLWFRVSVIFAVLTRQASHPSDSVHQKAYVVLSCQIAARFYICALPYWTRWRHDWNVFFIFDF